MWKEMKNLLLSPLMAKHFLLLIWKQVRWILAFDPYQLYKTAEEITSVLYLLWHIQKQDHVDPWPASVEVEGFSAASVGILQEARLPLVYVDLLFLTEKKMVKNIILFKFIINIIYFPVYSPRVHYSPPPPQYHIPLTHIQIHKVRISIIQHTEWTFSFGYAKRQKVLLEIILIFSITYHNIFII